MANDISVPVGDIGCGFATKVTEDGGGVRNQHTAVAME